jgi:hypothetical protein
VSALQVIDVIARCYDITAQSMSIMKVAPEDFLLLWPDIKTADRVLNKGLPLPGPGFTLLFKRWTQILKGVCWIQSAHPDSEARRDLSVFRVLAWCSQPNIVLAAVNLFIPEATAEVETLLSKRGLAYPLAISVVPGRAAVDDVQPPPSQRSNQSRRPPRWRRLRSPQPCPSAAEPEPSR